MFGVHAPTTEDTETVETINNSVILLERKEKERVETSAFLISLQTIYNTDERHRREEKRQAEETERQKKAVSAKIAQARENALPVVSVDYVKSRICDYFPEDCQSALTIAFHESGYRTSALSHTGDYGVFQINCYWQGYRIGMPPRTTSADCNRLYDLELNLQTAQAIYLEQGWSPWATKKYLD